MALVECYECKEMVSQHAETCPHCGCPLKPKKEEDEYYLTTTPRGGCMAEKVLAVSGGIAWIGGAIAAVACGIVFKSFWTFLIIAISAALCGLYAYCLSELCGYLDGIYAGITTLQLKVKHSKKK